MNPTPRQQKFRYGDLVYIAADLGPSMDHFHKGQKAFVLSSYYEQYGGNLTRDITMYSLFLKDIGSVSWYHEHQLTFIRRAPKLLQRWDEELRLRREFEDLLYRKMLNHERAIA